METQQDGHGTRDGGGDVRDVRQCLNGRPEQEGQGTEQEETGAVRALRVRRLTSRRRNER